MRQVIVHIDNLVLKGFRFEDRHAIAAAFAQELARGLAAPESARRLASLESVPRMQIGGVRLGAEAGPRRVGLETARAISARVIK